MKSLGMVRLCFVGLVLLASVFCRTALATDTYVSDAMGNDASNGLSWASAKKTIQAGVTAAGSSGTVLVTNGTYTLASGIAISQGVTVRSVNGRAETFVNGNGTYRCFRLDNANATIDGFTITNGNVGAGEYGGGVWCHPGNILNCTINSNQAPAEYGGGVYMGAGLMTNCTISDNSAYQGGGGVIFGGGTISNCVFTGNKSGNNAGGALYMVGGLLVGCIVNSNIAVTAGGILMNDGIMRNCAIQNNSATVSGAAAGGGGVWMAGGLAEGCVISNNIVSAWGGGIWCQSGAGIASNCTIVGNSATIGGGLFCHSGGGKIDDCVITANMASQFGGGIAIGDNNNLCTIRRCLIENNVANNAGGGVSFHVTYNTIENCTIVSNRALSCGGVFMNAGIANVHTARNCIVYFNIGDTDSNYGAGGTWAYSCTTPKPAGTGNIDDDPLFADFTGGDFHEKSKAGRWTAGGWVTDSVHSPCIDAGAPYNAANPESYFSNEPRPNGGRINMGAYGNTDEASKSVIPSGAVVTIN